MTDSMPVQPDNPLPPDVPTLTPAEIAARSYKERGYGWSESEPWSIKPDKKVAIVGFASSSRMLAPFTNPQFEVWSLNHAYTFIPAWSRWFEIHPRDHFTKNLMREGIEQDGKTHFKWLQDIPPEGKNYGPVYMQEVHPDIPASVRFPREELNAWLASLAGNEDGFYADDYYTSSISQMLALAMREGFGEIHLYGIDLLQDEEYFYQRAGAEYLIGLARGLGIRVYLPRQSALCRASYVYGYSEPPTDLKQLQPLVDFIEGKATQSEDLMHKCASDAGVMDGASQAFKMFEGWLEAGKTKEEMQAELEVQKAKVAKKHRDLLDGVKTLIGQAEAFKTSTVWIKHVARGGELKD